MYAYLLGDRLDPTVRGEPGFVGAMSFSDPHLGDAFALTLWASAGEAREAAARHGHAPLTVWEVSLRV